MRRSSWCDRAQAEPTVTLAAVLAVVFGLTAYALVLDTAVPTSERDLANPTLGRVHDRVTSGGVSNHSLLTDARKRGPAGYAVNVSLVSEGREWAVGPTPPPSVDRASRTVGVQHRPGTVRPGTLTVEVWS